MFALFAFGRKGDDLIAVVGIFLSGVMKRRVERVIDEFEALVKLRRNLFLLGRQREIPHEENRPRDWAC
jgi:hypothetical protein